MGKLSTANPEQHNAEGAAQAVVVTGHSEHVSVWGASRILCGDKRGPQRTTTCTRVKGSCSVPLNFILRDLLPSIRYRLVPFYSYLGVRRWPGQHPQGFRWHRVPGHDSGGG